MKKFRNSIIYIILILSSPPIICSARCSDSRVLEQKESLPSNSSATIPNNGISPHNHDTASLETPKKQPNNGISPHNHGKTSLEAPHKIPHQNSQSELEKGLSAISSDDIFEAIRIRDKMPYKKKLDRDILTWAIATSGNKSVPSSELIEARKKLQDWPYFENITSYLEYALFNEQPSARRILKVFAKRPPQTPEGTILLVSALVKKGNITHAKTILKSMWHKKLFDEKIENFVLQNFPSLLDISDHKLRMSLLLFYNNLNQAKRFATLAKAESLFMVWSVVNNKEPSQETAKLLDDASKKWSNDPCYLFSKIRYLRYEKKYADAGELLLKKRPRNAKDLFNPMLWKTEQQIISRSLANEKNFDAAYRVISDIITTTDTTYITESQFQAGWYALNFLNDLPKAEKHFNNIMLYSRSPLSRSRALYWLGRTAEKSQKQAKANQYYTRASAYPATFYGQLSTVKLGRNLLKFKKHSPTHSQKSCITSHSMGRVILRLEELKEDDFTRPFYKLLAQKLNSPSEIAFLSDMAKQRNGLDLVLEIGKTAYNRGLDVALVAFPLGIVPSDMNLSKDQQALVHAVARQESGFNTLAISEANAYGLMQILPSTAKDMATKLGIPWEPRKLLEDPKYNITLGLHYLEDKISRFGGSYILGFSAYNAGPRRTSIWLEQYGDPRPYPLDKVVDWIETIPIGETRNYVQRVMENYQVYKTLLGEKFSIASDLTAGSPK
ncbi:lytic transglycosylase domain-containing protein [Candidatus Liberibacter sp.]|uniref:lytic transglycosylase domain-containing protein n=1 Tax=Candidatus Liberibacter sp. TaxID=34022 RepID=UPI0015F37FD9|nr:lytic transglycosylase domain-containing protein [Candidatus Liberibacter sp.]MBA5723901.1 lytic transglycosylase domain-containing protein [Candidatus Liberibacter sp.]